MSEESTPEIPIQPQEPIQVQKAPELPKKKFNLLTVAVLLVVILLVGIGGVYAVRYFTRPKICTLEAKICPDGSAVGRVLPNCEFAPCPTLVPTVATASPTPDETVYTEQSRSANWKTYKDEKNGIEFKYPSDWYTKPLSGWTLNIFLENRSFEIPEATEFMTSIQISFNEAENTVTNEKFFLEKTLDEGTKRIKSLYDEKTVSVNNLVVSGKKAVQISGLSGPGMLEGQYFIYTLIQMDDHLLEVSLTNKEFKNIYDQILSTFKFFNQKETKYSCPQNGWENCMPILSEEGKLACSKEAETWYKANCPNFKGLAQ